LTVKKHWEKQKYSCAFSGFALLKVYTLQVQNVARM